MRLKKAWTHTFVAQKINRARRTAQSYESGRYKIFPEMAEKFAELFECTKEDALKNDNIKITVEEYQEIRKMFKWARKTHPISLANLWLSKKW